LGRLLTILLGRTKTNSRRPELFADYCGGCAAEPSTSFVFLPCSSLSQPPVSAEPAPSSPLSWPCGADWASGAALRRVFADLLAADDYPPGTSASYPPFLLCETERSKVVCIRIWPNSKHTKTYLRTSIFWSKIVCTGLSLLGGALDFLVASSRQLLEEKDWILFWNETSSFLFASSAAWFLPSGVLVQRLKADVLRWDRVLFYFFSCYLGLGGIWMESRRGRRALRLLGRIFFYEFWGQDFSLFWVFILLSTQNPQTLIWSCSIDLSSTWYLTTCVHFQGTHGSGDEGLKALEVSQRAESLPAMGKPEAAALCQDARWRFSIILAIWSS
jgi:hypothetical protein